MLEFINAIIYINLDERTDRKIHLLAELAKIPGFADSDIPKKIYRFPAIKGTTHQERIAACGQSHGEALKFAWDQNFNNVLILEDDFTWSNDISMQCERLQRFWDQYHTTFGMVQLASVIQQGFQVPETDMDHPLGLMAVEEASNAAGYFVNHCMIQELSDLILHSAEQLKTHYLPQFFMNDQCWNMMRKKYATYAFHPRMGYQMPDFSSIRQEYVREAL